jgi:formylglycine-generating enzyme required for sulfatase activity
MVPPRRAKEVLACVVAALGFVEAATSCSRAGGSRASGGKELRHGGPISSASATASATSRPGMAYIPAGVLLAGTPVDRAPRVAEEELPGTRVEMGDYFIDVLPFPNEAGAIATTNVNRDEAAALCTARNKRLCTELEWERACKGPANTTYEEGDDFHPATCGLGAAAELSAKRPTGELPACTSGFGVRELHGGAWEWTDLPWGRGGRKDLGALKGGNAVAGEIAGRCANSIARPPTTKSPAMGFRCCAGVKNEAKVELSTKVLPALERSMQTAEVTAPWLPFARATWPLRNPTALGAAPFVFVHAFVWRPVANETLVVASGCARDAPRRRCGLLVGRTLAGAEGSASDDGGTTVRVLMHVDTGFEAAEVAEVGEARRLRLKGFDATSAYLRDFSYAFGRIELGDIRR